MLPPDVSSPIPLLFRPVASLRCRPVVVLALSHHFALVPIPTLQAVARSGGSGYWGVAVLAVVVVSRLWHRYNISKTYD